MSLSDSSQSETLDEDLVAYLDGQLDSESARRVEQRLAGEDKVRRRLRELAQSWDMLDQLPHVTADDTFTRSTVEMVALAAEKELAEQMMAEPRRRRRRWLLVGLLALAVGVLGFVAAAKLWSDPNQRLLADLPVIDNLEVYRQVGDIEFLHKLNDEGLFSDESEAAPRSPASADDSRTREALNVPLDTLEQRHAYLDKLSPQDKEELRAKFEKFETFPPDEQERLRKFDVQLNRDPQEDRLRRIMARFHEWLKSIPSPTERAELLAMNSTDRIPQIKMMRHQWEARLAAQAGDARFGPQDVDALHKWMAGTFVKDHEAELLKNPPLRFAQDVKSLADANAQISARRRNQLLLIIAWSHWRPDRGGDGGKTISVTPEEWDKLKSQLSKGAQDALPADADKRAEVLTKWIKAVASARGSFNRQRNRAAANISRDELNKVLHEQSQVEQDRLLSLPSEEMDRQLRRKYEAAHGGRGTGFRDNPGGR